MKRNVLVFVIGFAIAVALFGGSKAPAAMQSVTVRAQSANPRGDLVTRTRQVVGKINAGFDEFGAIRNEYVGANVNFTSADLSGSNITLPATFVADDVDQVMTDLNNIITDVKAGGTISVGEWTNVMKVR